MAETKSPPSDVAVTTWIRLFRAQRRGLALVERKLKDAGLAPLEWYDVLLELERAGPLRPRELQSRLLLAQSNLSRLLDRMDQAGLVKRDSCAEDGRGLLIRLTPEGKAARRQIWPVYAAGIHAAVADKLKPAQLDELAELLRPLAEQPPS